MNDSPASSSQPPTMLPVVTQGVVHRYRVMPPEFEKLFSRIKRNNPVAAKWLLEAAEEIAPANVADKQRYATLALGLFHMFSEQLVINRLRQRYAMSIKPSAGSSVLLDDLSGNEVTSI